MTLRLQDDPLRGKESAGDLRPSAPPVPLGSSHFLASGHVADTPVAAAPAVSRANVYTGLPLYAHCFEPSSRVTMVQSPSSLALAAAASGGQAVTHWSMHADLPGAVSRAYV